MWSALVEQATGLILNAIHPSLLAQISREDPEIGVRRWLIGRLSTGRPDLHSGTLFLHDDDDFATDLPFLEDGCNVGSVKRFLVCLRVCLHALAAAVGNVCASCHAGRLLLSAHWACSSACGERKTDGTRMQKGRKSTGRDWR